MYLKYSEYLTIEICLFDCILLTVVVGRHVVTGLNVVGLNVIVGISVVVVSEI